MKNMLFKRKTPKEIQKQNAIVLTAITLAVGLVLLVGLDEYGFSMVINAFLIGIFFVLLAIYIFIFWWFLLGIKMKESTNTD